MQIAAPGNVIILRVEDTGPGIPEDQYERVFNRFQRIGGDRDTAGVPGCGLGLSIVRQIVELHQAQIILGKSEELGGLSVSIVFSGKRVTEPGEQNNA